MANGTDALIRKWRRIFGLEAWKIRLRDEPPPGPVVNTAFSEMDFTTKEAVVWARTEPEVIHELLHVLIEGLDDAFWRADRTKAIDALWKRREERVVCRLERAFVKVLRAK